VRVPGVVQAEPFPIHGRNRLRQRYLRHFDLVFRPAELMRQIAGFLVILLCLLAGELAASFSGVPVPGSVIGMLLLAGLLLGRLLRLELVRPAADLLLRYMGLFFVPPGVGLMLHFDLIAAEWPAILAASLASTLAVLVIVGLVQQRMETHA
jgi:holin-like protein